MLIVAIIIVLVVIVAIVTPLFKLLCLFGRSYTLHRIKISDIGNLVLKFLSARAEREVFITYLKVMTPSVIIPLSIDLAVKYVSPERSIYVDLQAADDYSMWVGLAYGLLATIGYGIYVYRMINKDRSAYSKEAIKGLSVINEVFGFEPNQEWFDKQAKNALKDLGKRYDKEHNIQHPQLSFILSTLNRDISSVDNWREDIESLIEWTNEVVEHCKDEKMSQSIQTEIDVIIYLVNIDEWREEEAKRFKTTIETIDKTLEKWHRALKQRDSDAVAYDWQHYQSILKKFKNYFCSPWFECLYKQAMLVKGQGGMGKSHLIGSIVDERMQHNYPTILILGEKIYDGPEPWSQIMGLLDIRCKKETFFKNLNNYASETGEHILIIVDAINENAGRDYWANHISSFVNEISEYEHIGLLMSIRTSNASHRIDEYVEDKSHATYEAPGFKDNLGLACEYMFHAYGLTTPSWAVIDGMFANPMWLHMYCESHQKLGNSVERENHWQIISNYVDGFESELAKECHYTKGEHLLRDSLFAIADRIIQNKRIVTLAHKEAFDVVNGCVGQEIDAKKFFNELLQIGVLRQEQSSGDAYISFEYESFGRYIVAYRLASTISESEWDEYIWTFINELSEIVPLVKDKELLSYIEDKEARRAFEDSFLETLQYRTKLTTRGAAFLQNVWDEKDYETIFEVIWRCAINPQIPYNASQLYPLLYDMPQMEREALWTTRISEYTDIRERLHDYAKWTVDASRETLAALHDDVAELLVEAMMWSLCSTQGKLRDTATKGLVSLLSKRQDLLLSTITRYHAVNDLYITERLWGVAYGCCSQIREIGYVESIAELAKNYVFEVDSIVEHILITDYAQLIIEYAKSLGSASFKDYTKHLPPYHSYASIPNYTDKFIVDTYEEPYESHADKNVSYSAYRILGSMAVEYSRKGVGGYGDFGRYTFQYSLSEFPEDPNRLSNWAVHMIFSEFGYKPEEVKWFDSQASHYGSADWERIGKKYQWLALYRIASILTDYHWKDGKKNPGEDPCLFSLRNIDPTVAKVDYAKVRELTGMHHKMPLYGYEEMDNNKWLHSPKHMPDVKELVRQKRAKGANLITLYAYDEYTLRKRKLSKSELNREFWCFIQSCFVKKSQINKVTKIINDIGISGRGFTENSEIYHLYAGEWYWSQNYAERVIDNEYEQKPLHISFNYFNDISICPSMIEYSHESQSDYSKDDGDTIYFPNSDIVRVLQLKLYDSRGIWTNANGEIVAYDNAVTGGKSALMIREAALLMYLKETNQVVLWPLLIEKRVKNWFKHRGDKDYKYVQSGGYVYMDERGKITSVIRQYDKEKTSAQRWIDAHIRPVISQGKKIMLDIGIRLHLVKLSEDERMAYMIRRALKRKIAERMSDIEERQNVSVG